MAETNYDYVISTDTANGKVAVDALEKAIRGSAIIIALKYATTLGDDLDVTFKDALSAGDETILNGLVSAHDGEPIEHENIQKVQTHIGAVNIKLLEFGFGFVATKETDTNGDKLLPVKYLRGAGVEAENHVFGDHVTVQIIDKDGLYYPAGTVLDVFGSEVYIPKTGLFTVLSDSISNGMPPGLYMRVIYHSAGTVLDVNVRVNCRGYNDV